MKDQKFSIEFKTAFECEGAQELLLSLGYRWRGGEDGVIDTGRRFGILFADNGWITHSDFITDEFRECPRFKYADIKLTIKHPSKGLLFGRSGRTSFLVEKNYVVINGAHIYHRDLVKITYEMDKFLGEDGGLMTDEIYEPQAPVMEAPTPTLNAPTQRIERNTIEGTQQWVDLVQLNPPQWILNNQFRNENTAIEQFLNDAVAEQGGVDAV